MSLDGCLTRHGHPGTGFASPADHAFFRSALQTFDCSIAGRHTYEAGRESILRARQGSRLQMILTSTPDRFEADALPEHLEFKNADTPAVVAELARRGRSRCALLGGPRLYTEACAHGLLDELWVTIEPVAFGEGARMFTGRTDFRFELVESVGLSADTFLLKYRRTWSRSIQARRAVAGFTPAENQRRPPGWLPR